jgi:hypothetical protein
MAFNELLTRVTNLQIKPGSELKRTAGVSFPAPERMHLTFDTV